DGRYGDPDVFFSRIAKDTAPFVLVQGFSIDDSSSNGDGDGAPEPGERPRLKVALENTGVAGATGVSAVRRTTTPGVTVARGASGYPDLGTPGSTATGRSLYQFSIDPALGC